MFSSTCTTVSPKQYYILFSSTSKAKSWKCNIFRHVPGTEGLFSGILGMNLKLIRLVNKKKEYLIQLCELRTVSKHFNKFLQVMGLRQNVTAKRSCVPGFLSHFCCCYISTSGGSKPHRSIANDSGWREK